MKSLAKKTRGPGESTSLWNISLSNLFFSFLVYILVDIERQFTQLKDLRSISSLDQLESYCNSIFQSYFLIFLLILSNYSRSPTTTQCLCQQYTSELDRCRLDRMFRSIWSGGIDENLTRPESTATRSRLDQHQNECTYSNL